MSLVQSFVHVLHDSLIHNVRCLAAFQFSSDSRDVGSVSGNANGIMIDTRTLSGVKSV
jgi:hypothetical protein